MDLNTICCEAPKTYSEEYDCYYCEPCNIWSESKCDDLICEYCINRPVTPKEVND
jgi:hypothetical protein